MANVFLPAATATAIGNPVESGWGIAMRLALEAAAPAGEVGMFVGEVAPDGWLLMQGQTVAGFSTTYPVAWGRMPSAWKSGSAIMFPDTRARVAVGSAGYGDFVLGSTGGLNDAPITLAQMPAHNHTGSTDFANVDHAHYTNLSAWSGGRNADHSHAGWTDNQGQHGHNLGHGTTMYYDNHGGWGYVLNTGGPFTISVAGAQWLHDGTHAHNVGTHGASADHAHNTTIAGWTGGHNVNHIHTIPMEGTGVTRSNLQAHFVISFMVRVY